MNKLSKTQREQLISIAIGAVALMAALYYFGVMAKQSELASTQKKSADMAKKLRDAESLMRRQDEIDNTLKARSDALAKREASLAPERDAYAWLINTMNNFVQAHKGITIDSYSQPEITDDGLIPRFPYRWATFKVKGSCYYQDVGKFFADFENTFPYFRIQSPDFTPNSTPGTDPEKLNMAFDIVTPVLRESK